MARTELRKIPQNIEAEISVLGCGFLDRTALDKIMDEVSDEMFYDPKNRTIYKAMKSLHQNNIPVDVNTICNELDKDKSLSDVGGVEYITEIINSVPSTANLNYYIKIIFEKSVLRNLIEKADRIQEECYNEDDSIENIFGYPDYLKLNSCMTLFEYSIPEEKIFSKTIDKFYNGKRDRTTLDMLKSN